MADKTLTVAWAREGDSSLHIEDTVATLVGWGSGEVPAALTLISSNKAENARRIEEILRRSGSIHSTSYQTEIVRKDGERVSVESHVVALKGHNGPLIIGVVCPRCEVRALWNRLSDESRRLLWRIGQRLADMDEALAI